MDLNLEGKRALITGSSRGIGEGIAKALAREGAIVVIHGRKEEDAKRVANEIVESGGRAFISVGDLGNDEGAQKVTSSALTLLGSIDILGQ